MARKKKEQKRTRRKVSGRVAFKGGDLKKRITIILNNLLLFVALSLVSLVFYNFLQNDILKNLFYVMSMVFGFVSVAFLITLLVLVIMKVVKKK